MTHADLWIGFALLVVMTLLIVAAILSVGYIAYRARKAKEEAKLEKRLQRPDPVEELAEVNERLEASVQQAGASLEATRDAIRDDVKW